MEKINKKLSNLLFCLVFSLGFTLVAMNGSSVFYKTFETWIVNTWDQMMEKELEGTLSINNIPVYQEGDTCVTDYDLKQISNLIPQVLMENCTAIYVCDPDISTTCSTNFYDDSKSFASDVGGYVVDDGTGRVYINDKMRGPIWKTLTHELMHLYDYRYGLSKQESGLNLYLQNKTVLTKYAQTNESEFLAEAAELYFIDQSMLQMPERLPIYNYFKGLFPEFAQY